MVTVAGVPLPPNTAPPLFQGTSVVPLDQLNGAVTASAVHVPSPPLGVVGVWPGSQVSVWAWPAPATRNASMVEATNRRSGAGMDFRLRREKRRSRQSP